jgi:transcriptional regulator with XRE-family HTH domain
MREAAGISLRDLAAAIGRDRGHLSRVERDERKPTPALEVAYREAVAGTVNDVRRRAFLAAGTALPVLALADTPAPKLVGEPEVAAVRALALDLDLSHPFAVATARAALQRAVAMLHGRVRPAIKPSLHAAVAMLADRVGWGLFEVGRDPAAALALAHRTARTGDDPDLAAHALIDLAVTTGEPAPARAALSAPRVSGAQRVNLGAVAARLTARHDPAAAREHLARALDTAPEAGPDGWAARMVTVPGHLDAIVGFAGYATGHPEARARLAAAVEHLGAHRHRTRARCHVRLAGLALRDGDDTATVAHLDATREARRATTVVRDLRAFAAEANATGRRDLARYAVTANHR